MVITLWLRQWERPYSITLGLCHVLFLMHYESSHSPQHDPHEGAGVPMVLHYLSCYTEDGSHDTCGYIVPRTPSLPIGTLSYLIKREENVCPETTSQFLPASTSVMLGALETGVRWMHACGCTAPSTICGLSVPPALRHGKSQHVGKQGLGQIKGTQIA